MTTIAEEIEHVLDVFKRRLAPACEELGLCEANKTLSNGARLVIRYQEPRRIVKDRIEGRSPLIAHHPECGIAFRGCHHDCPNYDSLFDDVGAP